MFGVLALTAALGVALQGPPPDSLTLDAALALARAHRSRLTAAGAVAAVARAEFRVAGTIPNPVAAYQYTGDPPRHHVTLEQPLDWLLRRAAERQAGRAGVQAAAADSTQMAARVEREVRTAFFRALGTAQQLALALDEADLADSLAAIAARRRAVGEIGALEAAQAHLEAVRARQVVSTSREDHAAATAELGRALGLLPETLPPLTGALDRDVATALPAAPPVDDLPMVARAVADSVMALGLYRSARASRVPFPSVLAGIEWNDPTAVNQRATILLGVALPLPLWQAGAGQAAVAHARAQQAAAELDETRAAAVSALAQVRSRAHEAALRALVARDSIAPLASRQRELALVAYRAGETGFAAVLEALRAEREVGRALVTDLVAYQAARAEWLELIGETP